MTKDDLVSNIKRKGSFLCIDLDPDLEKIPSSLLEEDDPLYTFNCKIIDATAEFVVAYKLNITYYETVGPFGIRALERTIEYIHQNHPDILVLADRRCAEYGTAADVLVRNYFDHLKVDGLTAMPYLGRDAVSAIARYPDRWLVLLSLTPNSSNEELQLSQDLQGEYLFERVIRLSKSWVDADQPVMYIVGVDDDRLYERVRMLLPNQFLFIPTDDRILDQLENILRKALTDEAGVIVNISQSLIYADESEQFAVKAAQIAGDFRQRMFNELIGRGIIER